MHPLKFRLLSQVVVKLTQILLADFCTQAENMNKICMVFGAERKLITHNLLVFPIIYLHY